MGKSVIIGSEARDRMKKGVDILADAVKATLGPRGRHAAIERAGGGPPIITKDGVTVARYIDLTDRVENMGAQLIKSVASDANMVAGDGTTTATVLAQEIYGRGIKFVSSGNNPVLLKRGIDIAVEAALEELSRITIKVDDEKTLSHVATISANNDRKLGEMIAEAVSTVGNDGLISVEDATGNVTEVVYSEGLKIERGWLNENFVTNQARYTCEMEDCLVLLYDSNIKTIHMLVEILNQVINSAKPILIVVRDIQPEALSHLVLNKINGSLRCCVIKAQGYGDFRRGMMEDISVITGATLFKNDDGKELAGITMDDLGVAKRVIVGPNMTKIIEGVASHDDVDREVENLRVRLKEADIFEHQELVIRERISRLTGGVAIFKVGATSEGELREKKDRIEDAINAVKSAISEGVVSGGGCALLHCIKAIDEIDLSELIEEEILGIKIIRESLKAPFNQILINAGVEEERTEYMRRVMSSDGRAGFDALRLEFIDDMLARGIVDPAKVVRSSLEHAASASGILLTTEVAISLEDVSKK